MNSRDKVPSEERRASFGLVKSSKAEAEGTDAVGRGQVTGGSAGA